MKSLEGTLLVASPYLHDSPFTRSVIFMVQHDEEGALGVVLNRPAGPAVAESLRQSGLDPDDGRVQVNVGGPVMNSVVALQQQPTGVRACSEPDACEAAIRRAAHGGGGSRVRIYIGHAGWSPGQLETELSLGFWMTASATCDHVFGDDEDLWVTTVREIGRSVLRDSLGIRSVPSEVGIN